MTAILWSSHFGTELYSLYWEGLAGSKDQWVARRLGDAQVTERIGGPEVEPAVERVRDLQERGA